MAAGCNEEEISINLIIDVVGKCSVIKLVEHLRAWRPVIACDQSSFLIYADKKTRDTATKTRPHLLAHIDIRIETPLPSTNNVRKRFLVVFFRCRYRKCNQAVVEKS